MPELADALALGLTREEYELVCEKQGGAPNALEAGGQIVLRYAPGENPNGAARDVAGVCNEAGNVMGLMPHPEHAVDELCGGSADGLKLFASAAVAHA